MRTIETQDSAPLTGEELEQETFGKSPQPWQLRNNWTPPKRKRNRAKAKIELDLWQEER